ncbi:hypothetical protein NIES73_34370 [Sphaerospermopsis kisseleviana NIES-73]|jgi:hypothetical protein|nr:hypothetical protein NIES73_34370 [Sphaerospermopsis kisseleviana NIES-73]
MEISPYISIDPAIHHGTPFFQQAPHKFLWVVSKKATLKG